MSERTKFQGMKPHCAECLRDRNLYCPSCVEDYGQAFAKDAYACGKADGIAATCNHMSLIAEYPYPPTAENARAVRLLRDAIAAARKLADASDDAIRALAHGRRGEGRGGGDLMREPEGNQRNSVLLNSITDLATERDALRREVAGLRETLRDRFAMAALPECIQQSWGMGEDADAMKSMAECAYQIADAMLAARAKPPSTGRGEE